MPEGFRDDLLSNSPELDNCLVCQKPTRSHLILLAYDADADRMVRAEELDDSDAYGHVCHTCASDRDMDADAVVDAYNEWITGILDEHGVPMEDFAQRPGEVAEEYDLPEV